jgi:hypothetical protein
MLTLDVLGKLHLYAGVFNLDVYNGNKAWYIGYVLAHRRTNPHYREIWEAMKRRGFPIGLGVRYSMSWHKQRVSGFIKRRMGMRAPRF